MNGAIPILLVEDNPRDAQLIADVLIAEGLAAEIERVETREHFEHGLERADLKLVLSDYSLPSFDGLAALGLARARRPELPFILISGTLGEEHAVESVRAGASDYVLKQRIARLPQVVTRALQEAEERERRRQAEGALRETEARYQALVETAFDWIWEVDAQARYTYSSPRILPLLGYHPEEVLGQTPFDFMPPDEATRVRRLFEQAAARRESFALLENVNRHRDGRLVVLETSGAPILGADGSLLGYRGMDRDITARKKAESELRKLARAVDQSSAAIVITDRCGNIEFVNPKFCQLTGYTVEEVLGRNPRILKGGETTPEQYRQLWETISRGQEWRGRLHNRRKDGTLYWESASISAIRDHEGQITHFLAIKEDLTTQIRLENQLLRAQRVESIGRLAGGVAHDLNNILAPILMATSLLKEGVTPEETGPLVDIIAGSAQRGADVVKQLLTFARGSEGKKLPLAPARLLKEMTRIIQETFPKSIMLRTDVPKDVWLVLGDPTQLHQVLLNLCVNARDAMPGGGTLTLAAQNIMVDECYAGMLREAKPGPYVLLTVADTGVGMSAEVLGKIFDPFFTTKGPEMGTGLGLATVQGIVRSHEGHIVVESELHRGSQFKVFLPAQPVANPLMEAAVVSDLPNGHGELVLVVDDEPSVREVTERILTKHGYRVMTAREGTAAAGLYAKHQAEIRVVLTDLMMPVMDGAATVRVIREMNPGVKTIVASGAGEKAKLAEVEALKVQAFLPKPFTARELLVTLEQVLQGDPPSSGVLE